MTAISKDPERNRTERRRAEPGGWRVGLLLLGPPCPYVYGKFDVACGGGETVGDPAHSFGAATASAYRGSALTHDRPRILTCCDGEPPVPTGVYRVRMLAKGVDRVGK